LFSLFLLPFGIKSATISYHIAGFNAPHRTVRADFPHTALQSVSLDDDSKMRIFCQCHWPSPCRESNSIPIKTHKVLTGSSRYQSKSCWCRVIHISVWPALPQLWTTDCRPLRVSPQFQGLRRALPRLRLYYEPVRLPYLYGPALPRRLVGACKQYGYPKFRCNPSDDPLRSATPARRCSLAILRLQRYWLQGKATPGPLR